MPKITELSSSQVLVLILLLFSSALAFIAHRAASYAVELVHGQGPTHLNPAGSDADIYIFIFILVVAFLLFTTLPLMMVIAYRGLAGNLLSGKVRASLSLCNLDDEQLQQRIEDFERRNRPAAFILPSLVTLLLLYIVWNIALLPMGTTGVFSMMLTIPDFNLSQLFARSAAALTPLTWALLGAYFYGLTLMVQRWMLTDLTINVLWRITVRLVVTFILGMLLMSLASGPAGLSLEFGNYLSALAFMVGIVPDIFLRWVSQQVKRLGGVDAAGQGRLFGPSQLQGKVDGMSYWQVDRLAEEGIDSVQDLAMKEIPTLLIKTRFDPPLLLQWVDRALLCAQVGSDLDLFKRAHCYTATDFASLVGAPGGAERLLRSLSDAAAATPAVAVGPPAANPITAPIMANIMSGLNNGPNLRYLTAYRNNVNGVPDASPAPAGAAAALSGPSGV